MNPEVLAIHSYWLTGMCKPREIWRALDKVVGYKMIRTVIKWYHDDWMRQLQVADRGRDR
jgi:hypothetical protein